MSSESPAALSLRGFPNVSFQTVPERTFAASQSQWLKMVLSQKKKKKNRPALPQCFKDFVLVDIKNY